MQDFADNTSFDKKDKSSWSMDRRLEFIESRLYWCGQINRSDLISAFRISTPQASADLTRYQEIAPENLAYDKSAKAYTSTENFQPKLIQPSADRVLADLRMKSVGILNDSELYGVTPESFSTVPILRRKIEPTVLREVLQAIRKKECLEVLYQSIERSEPLWRQVTPHALAFDGFRWHVRAWCHKRSSFRDFVLSRIVEAKGKTPSHISTEDDLAWNEYINLVIVPHPGCSKTAKKVIEADYGMSDGKLEVRLRACLVFYFQKHYGLEKDPKDTLPSEQHIVLKNHGHVQKVLMELGVTNSKNEQDRGLT